MKDYEIQPALERTATSAPNPIPLRSPAQRIPVDGNHAVLVAGALDIDLAAAERLLQATRGLSHLLAATQDELVAAGLTQHKAKRLRCATELTRIAFGQRPIRGQRLAGASDVWAHMRARLSHAPVEEFWVIALDVRHRVLFDEMLARGTLTGVDVHPRDAFRPLIRAGAAAVLFCHQHPSGDPTPSRADIELTSRLREVGELCGIPVLDHVVVGDDGYVSIAERGWR